MSNMNNASPESYKSPVELAKIKSPESLLKFMQTNVKYGVKTMDGLLHFVNDVDFDDAWRNGLVQTGDEMTKTLCGTCWDQVELERKWFIDNDYVVKSFFIWYEMIEKNDLPTHAFLAYIKDGKWAWFENSMEPRIQEFNSINDLLIKAVDEYHKSTEIQQTMTPPDRSKIKVYEYPEITHDMRVDEYINFVTKSDLQFC